jgi:hypothetical protein
VDLKLKSRNKIIVSMGLAELGGVCNFALLFQSETQNWFKMNGKCNKGCCAECRAAESSLHLPPFATTPAALSLSACSLSSCH